MSASRRKGKPKAARPAKSTRKRLRPGQLDGLVLAYMHKHDGPLTAGAIGEGIGRSSGAVANCLIRLAKEKKVRLAKKKPRSYAISGVRAK